MSDPKTARLEIKLTPALKASVQEKASRIGVSASEYARAVLALASGFDDESLRGVLVARYGVDPGA